MMRTIVVFLAGLLVAVSPQALAQAWGEFGFGANGLVGPYGVRNGARLQFAGNLASGPNWITVGQGVVDMGAVGVSGPPNLQWGFPTEVASTTVQTAGSGANAYFTYSGSSPITQLPNEAYYVYIVRPGAAWNSGSPFEQGPAFSQVWISNVPPNQDAWQTLHIGASQTATGVFVGSYISDNGGNIIPFKRSGTIVKIFPQSTANGPGFIGTDEQYFNPLTGGAAVQVFGFPHLPQSAESMLLSVSANSPNGVLLSVLDPFGFNHAFPGGGSITSDSQQMLPILANIQCSWQDLAVGVTWPGAQILVAYTGTPFAISVSMTGYIEDIRSPAFLYQ
jgi:hypothetical protein